MTTQQRKRLDDLKVRLETLQNAGSRAAALIWRAEEATTQGEVERNIAQAEKELSGILKKKR